MPISFGFVDKLPMPSLRNYVAFSVLLLSGLLYHSYSTVKHDTQWQIEFNQSITDKNNAMYELVQKFWPSSSLLLVIQEKDRVPLFLEMVCFMLTNQLCIWVSCDVSKFVKIIITIGNGCHIYFNFGNMSSDTIDNF